MATTIRRSARLASKEKKSYTDSIDNTFNLFKKYTQSYNIPKNDLLTIAYRFDEWYNFEKTTIVHHPNFIWNGITLRWNDNLSEDKQFDILISDYVLHNRFYILYDNNETDIPSYYDPLLGNYIFTYVYSYVIKNEARKINIEIDDNIINKFAEWFTTANYICKASYIEQCYDGSKYVRKTKPKLVREFLNTLPKKCI